MLGRTACFFVITCKSQLSQVAARLLLQLVRLHTERPASTADMLALHGYKPVLLDCGVQAHVYVIRGAHTVHLLLAP